MFLIKCIEPILLTSFYDRKEYYATLYHKKRIDYRTLLMIMCSPQDIGPASRGFFLVEFSFHKSVQPLGFRSHLCATVLGFL